MPKGKVVVLGLVTTRRGELESKDELKRRVEGNKLAHEQQAAKLRLVVEVAEEVWG